MVIIGFAPRSSKILPNLICKNFKHCVVLVRDGDVFKFYQFISKNHVEQISITPRDLRILERRGWKFVYVPCDIPIHFNPNHAWTCVNMAKSAIGVHAPFIQTPDALFKYINS